MKKIKKRYWENVIVVFLVLIFISIWELLSYIDESISFFISSPKSIIDALTVMFINEGLVWDIGITAAEALIGIIIGTLLGSTVGLFLWLNKSVARISGPFILIAANFPVFALAPIAIVWLGIGIWMKIVLAGIATFFLSLNFSFLGADEASKKYGTVFDGFNASKRDTYLKVILPGAIGAVFESIRPNVSLGILGAFIGEFIAAERGLGKLIIQYSGLYQVDKVFAASLCIIMLAITFDRIAFYIEKERLVITRFFGIPSYVRGK